MQTILLSAVFAGLVAIAVTVPIERWGGVIGGIIGTLPTTIVPAAIGMYLAGGQDALLTSLSLVPFWMVLNSLFVGLWVLYPWLRKDVKLLEMAVVSLVSWAFLAILFSLCLNFAIERYSRFLIGLLGMFVLITLGIWMTWRPTDAPRGSRSVSHGVLLMFIGLII